MYALILTEGTADVPKAVLVRRMANLSALARRLGYTPVAPQLTALTADLLVPDGAPSGEPGAVDGEDLAALAEYATAVWTIANKGSADEEPTNTRSLSLTWSEWHARLVQAGLGHLDEFDHRRPRLDRWPGDGDPASFHVDAEAKTVRLQWPLFGLDATIGGKDSKADPLFTVIATLLRAPWEQIRSDLPALAEAADKMDSRMLAEVIRMGLVAGSVAPAVKADLQERLKATGLDFIELPDPDPST